MQINAKHYLDDIEKAFSQAAIMQTNDLRHIQQQALEKFNLFGLPTARHDAWKYTPLQFLQQQKYATATNVTTSAHLPWLSEQNCILFVNGRLASNKLANPILRDFSHPTIADHLPSFYRNIDNGITALNFALATDGYTLLINETIAEPIHIIYVVNENNIAMHIRNLIVMAENSNATIIEHFISENNENYLTNMQTDVLLAKKAKLQHYKIQQESLHAMHFGKTFATLNQHAEFNSHVFTFGGKLSRSDIYVELVEQNAECRLNGLYFTQQKQHADHYTEIHHLNNRTTSKELYKGIAAGQSRGIFTGKIHIHKNANQSDATQTNKNLLLSIQAEIDTRPQLEIYHDQVKCAHGATIGQLDHQALFYLMSRGIPEITAKRMLIESFGLEMFDYIEHLLTKEFLQTALHARILETLGLN